MSCTIKPICKAKWCRSRLKISKGYCKIHYMRRLYRIRYGIKTPLHLKLKMRKLFKWSYGKCKLRTCDKQAKIRGYCSLHSAKLVVRKRLGLDPAKYPLSKNLPRSIRPTLKNGEKRKKWSPGRGRGGSGTWYWMVRAKGHYLAQHVSTGNYWVAEHRMKMYEKIGKGRHRCWMCNKSLSWNAKKVRKKIVINHLNEIGTHNRLSNLRVSCNNCNHFYSRYKSLRRIIAKGKQRGY